MKKTILILILVLLIILLFGCTETPSVKNAFLTADELNDLGFNVSSVDYFTRTEGADTYFNQDFFGENYKPNNIGFYGVSILISENFSKLKNDYNKFSLQPFIEPNQSTKTEISNLSLGEYSAIITIENESLENFYIRGVIIKKNCIVDFSLSSTSKELIKPSKEMLIILDKRLNNLGCN